MMSENHSVDEATLSLDELPCNVKAVIAHVRGEGALQQKFLDMGFIPGVEIEKVRSAPLLDPIQVQVLGCYVSMRRQEAKMLEVRRVAP